MDPIQLTIIAVVVVLILVTIGYYLYQEAKFKKMVENNFNQATEDIIIDENKAFILDGVDTQKQKPGSVMQKDVINSTANFNDDPLFDMHEAAVVPEASNMSDAVAPVVAIKQEESTIEEPVYPENSVEAFFAEIHKIPFPYRSQINPNLDFIVDIGFEEIIKIKILPELTQFTNKPFRFYVLDKNNEWSIYTKGEKYALRALKLVVPLVDCEGIISQAQLANIYNELHKFVIQNGAHICKSDYEEAISKIQHQVKALEKIELNLSLYLITQENYSYSDLAKFFAIAGLTDNNGTFQLVEDSLVLFEIRGENNNPLEHDKSYNLFQLTASLHKQPDPNHAIEKVFDFAEHFMQNFESRLLTSNKKPLQQKDYDAILLHVRKYVENAKISGVKLGGDLIKRLF